MGCKRILTDGCGLLPSLHGINEWVMRWRIIFGHQREAFCTGMYNECMINQSASNVAALSVLACTTSLTTTMKAQGRTIFCMKSERGLWQFSCGSEIYIIPLYKSTDMFRKGWEFSLAHPRLHSHTHLHTCDCLGGAAAMLLRESGGERGGEWSGSRGERVDPAE